MTSGFCFKMKVHPAMFMKTKERGKIRVPNVRKDAWTSSPKPVACRMGHDSNFWLLTSGFRFKNEGASGDVDETKERGKIRGPMSGRMPGPQVRSLWCAGWVMIPTLAPDS